MKIGDSIFYQSLGQFYADVITDIQVIDGKKLYEAKNEH